MLCFIAPGGCCQINDAIFFYPTVQQHLVCRVVQSLHTNHMQMSIIEVSICRRLHMDTSIIDTHLHMVGMQTLHNSAY